MDYVKINGEDEPFWFAIKAQRELSKNSEDKDNMFLLWLGFKYGAMKESKDFTMNEDQLVDIFEDDISAYHEAGKLLVEQMGKLRGPEAVK